MEVETPMLNPLPGVPMLGLVTHHNALDMDLYLSIAPELYLKRLLVGGFERVFEWVRTSGMKGFPRNTIQNILRARCTTHAIADI